MTVSMEKIPLDSIPRILLPGEPGFYETLHGHIAPWERKTTETNSFCVRLDTGLLEAITTQRELDEYLYGGEFDEAVNFYKVKEDSVEYGWKPFDLSEDGD